MDTQSNIKVQAVSVTPGKERKNSNVNVGMDSDAAKSKILSTPTKKVAAKKIISSRTDSGITNRTPTKVSHVVSSPKPVLNSPMTPAGLPPRGLLVKSPQIRKVLGEPFRKISPAKPSTPRETERDVHQLQSNDATPKKPTRKPSTLKESTHTHADVAVTDRKLTELRNEIQVLRSIVVERDQQITQLEKTVSELRLTTQRYQSEAQKARRESGELQQTYSKKYRGSLSKLEAHLDEHSSESNARIEALAAKHAAEITEIKDSMAQKQEQWLDLVEQKNSEISTLNGRLEEARNSRQSTLDEMKILSKKYSSSIQEMEEALKTLLNKYQTLQKEKEALVSGQNAAENLLKKSNTEKRRLSSRLDQVSNETDMKQKKIEELGILVTRLEASLNSFDKQKTQFMESTKNYVENGHKQSVECGSAQTLMQQLEKCQRLLDTTKDSLIMQTQKAKELEKSNNTLDQELSYAKVDLRIEKRERKDVEAKLAQEVQERQKLKSRCDQLEVEKSEASEKLKELEMQIERINGKTREETELISQQQGAILEKEQRLREIESTLTQLQHEHLIAQNKINELTALISEVNVTAEKLKANERLLESKDSKIAEQKTSINLLKEACLVLEDQLKDFESAIAQKCGLVEELLSSKVSLTNDLALTRENANLIQEQLNAANGSNMFLQQKLNDLENNLQVEGCGKNLKIQALTEKLALLQRTNSNLSDQLDCITSKFTENEGTRICQAKVLENKTIECNQFKEQLSHQLTQIMDLKRSKTELTRNLESTTSKMESYELNLKSALNKLDQVKAEKHENEVRWKATLDQQSKLIDHLQHQNELLSKKKKTISEKIFGRDKDLQQMPAATAPMFISNDHVKDPSVVQHESKGQNKQMHVVCSTPLPITVQKENSVLLQLSEVLSSLSDSNVRGITKNIISQQEGDEKLNVNSVKNVFDELFLFGCENGLYSMKSGSDASGRVKIDGLDSIHQIEYIPNINYAVLSEGKDRRLGLVPLGHLRNCAEASQTSRPKIKLQLLPEQEGCNLFRTGKTASENIVLVVATAKTLNVLFWEKDTFVQKLSLRTPKTVTCIVVGPTSIIYGSDKIFELDLNNFAVEEFLDESDESLLYVKTTCRNSANYPVAIFDVSMDPSHSGKPAVGQEYLLCFSDVGIFTDAYGRRSRELDVVWSKLPSDMAFKSPDLFIFHFGSVEIIRLTNDSYRKERTGDAISNIPESRMLQLSGIRLLGVGKRQPSVYVGCVTKDRTTIYEVFRTPESKEEANH